MPVAIVLLAAGSSRRFQGKKLLYQMGEKPMYRCLVDELTKLPKDFFSQRVLVTQYPEIAKDLEGEGYQVIFNYETELGISHSIALAIGALAPEIDSVCFAVCDQPYLRGETVKGLIEGFFRSKKGMGCLIHEGEFGNPAVFSMRYREELLALTGDVGGRKVIRRHLDDLYLHEAEDGKELVDIDIRGDAT